MDPWVLAGMWDCGPGLDKGSENVTAWPKLMPACAGQPWGLGTGVWVSDMGQHRRPWAGLGDHLAVRWGYAQSREPAPWYVAKVHILLVPKDGGWPCHVLPNSVSLSLGVDF